MQIHNNLSPGPYGLGVRPDHTAPANSRGPKFSDVSAEIAPDTTTEASGEPAPAADTEQPNIPGKSVAHQARAQLAALSGLDGHNFGWLVSQIARGQFDAAAYASQDTTNDGTQSADGAAAADETTTGAADQTTPPTDGTNGSTDQASDGTGTSDTSGTPDPAAALLDELAQAETPDSAPAPSDTAAATDPVDALLNSETDSGAVA